MFVVVDQGVDVVVGEDFQQYGIWYLVIDDVCVGYVVLYCFQGVVDFWQYVVVDGVVGDQFVDLFGGQFGQYLVLFVYQVGDVGQQYQFFGFQCFCYFVGYQVGIDVVGFVVVVYVDWCDYWNEVVFDQYVQQFDVDFGDFVYVVDVDDFWFGYFWGLVGYGEFFCVDQFGVFVGQVDGVVVVVVDQVDDVFVYLVVEDYFYYVYGCCVGDVYVVDEVVFD